MEKEVCIGKMTEAELRGLTEILLEVTEDYDDMDTEGRDDERFLALCEITDRLSKALEEW